MAARHRKKRAELRKTAPAKVGCGECGKPAGLVDGRTVYPHRPDLAHKRFWRCCVCGAYVGCHPGTSHPLGTPCGPETRRARNAAHAAFDPLWRRKMTQDGAPQHEARNAAYSWLAGELGLEIEKTHIGMFDLATAQRVVEVCAPFNRSAEA